ncbi:hypothetical protein CC78DRAFT_574290 [Lojkania enalia]|uniref:Uncharacterized protein n=1 Tax=Lojkania enalia TaxID=147567 RepID=A0A9P4NBH3_9PLEO|nr:hypothetical protein CC78DRAFT_574290 [Didymosphaeria enalia]
MSLGDTDLRFSTSLSSIGFKVVVGSRYRVWFKATGSLVMAMASWLLRSLGFKKDYWKLKSSVWNLIIIFKTVVPDVLLHLWTGM